MVHAAMLDRVLMNGDDKRVSIGTTQDWMVHAIFGMPMVVIDIDHGSIMMV